MSGSGHGGAALGGVRMVYAVTLAGVPLGSCVVFISGIRSGSGRVMDCCAGRTSGLSHIRRLASYFILSVVIIVISPFCQIRFSFSRGKDYKEKRKKSSGTGTNFHLAVEKGCVQRFVDIQYLTWSILGTLNNGILKLIDA